MSFDWKNVFLHTISWLFLLLLCNAYEWEWGVFGSQDGTLLVSSIYGILSNALIFYGHALYFYPLLRKNRSKARYYLSLLFFLLVVSILEANVDYAYLFYTGTEEKYLTLLRDIELPEQYSYWFFQLDYVPFNSMVNTFYLLTSVAYVRWRENARKEEQLKELQYEKTKAELNYLKAQINPHFLFNGINSVYHLIDRKPALAKHTLMKFSGLLRYQLYECNEDFIALEKELDYVTDYLAMERIRRGTEVLIVSDIEVFPNQLRIAPLLLNPFLENAFKYLSHYADERKNEVVLKLHTVDRQLQFCLKNTYEASRTANAHELGGIGLQNVRKRLALLYPNRHELKLRQQDGYFIVELNIQL
ncbi:MAG: sensor histidine kinase [Bacteroidota bacterium]